MSQGPEAPFTVIISAVAELMVLDIQNAIPATILKRLFIFLTQVLRKLLPLNKITVNPILL